MNGLEGLFKLSDKVLKRYSVMNEDDEEDGVEWLAQFHLSESEFDDSFDENYRDEVVLVAPDFETAFKYAQQYIRSMKSKQETKDQWSNAELVSLDRR